MLIVKFIPNLFSLFRIFCIPFLLYSLLNQNRLSAFLILSIGAISDFLDGYLARKFHVESKLGELLDPLADKLFSNSVLWGLYFSISPTLPILLVAILLTLRDLVLLFGAFVVIFKKIPVNIKPVYISKICTTVIFIYIILLTIIDSSNIYLSIIGYSCLVLVALTFFVYIKRFFENKI